MTMDEDIEVLDVTLEEDEYDLARRRMRELYRMSFVLLSRPERLILYKILKDYRFRRDLIRLVLGLNVLIRTQSKIELLKHIRYFVWEGHIKDFDRYTKFHEKFRPRKPRDLHNRSATSSRYSPVPSRSSRISAHNTRYLAKTKTHFSNTLTVPSRGRLTCSINVKAIYLINLCYDSILVLETSSIRIDTSMFKGQFDFTSRVNIVSFKCVLIIKLLIRKQQHRLHSKYLHKLNRLKDVRKYLFNVTEGGLATRDNIYV